MCTPENMRKLYTVERKKREKVIVREQETRAQYDAHCSILDLLARLLKRKKRKSPSRISSWNFYWKVCRLNTQDFFLIFSLLIKSLSIVFINLNEFKMNLLLRLMRIEFRKHTFFVLSLTTQYLLRYEISWQKSEESMKNEKIIFSYSRTKISRVR